MIVAAAIRATDGAIWTLPPPARHHDIGHYMIACGETSPYPSDYNQGFLDSDMGFLNRLDAHRMAWHCGQLKQMTLHPSGQLFSENLW